MYYKTIVLTLCKGLSTILPYLVRLTPLNMGAGNESPSGEPGIAEVIPISNAPSYVRPEANQDGDDGFELRCARRAHELGLKVIRSEVGELLVQTGEEPFPHVADHLRSINKLPE